MASMSWMDERWDEAAGLLWTAGRDRHMPRETAWYTLGLLSRAGTGDEGRAVMALESVLANQYNVPGVEFHGSFRRAPEDPDPPSEPVMWLHYDPNWRQFVGTTLAVVVDRYSSALPAALIRRIRSAIELAVTGEQAGRVAPTYSNIALMKAWLDVWSGRVSEGEDLARRTYAHFTEHGAFLEYNSPTYYGIDLWALGLWRDSTETMQELGRELEERLWRDVGRFYHAGLRNMCGPFDRAYGMDMTRYATPLGLWIWAAAGREHAPFPDPASDFDHANDTCFGPLVAELGPRVPDDVLTHLSSFTGERFVEQTITNEPLRVATAWLDDDVMIGAQTGPASGIGWLQHHHATLHRRTDDGVAWMRLLPEVPADARAVPHRLTVESNATRALSFEVLGDIDDLTDVETNASGRSVQRSGDRSVVSYEPAANGPTTVSFGV
jgi:hypothetical protein